MFLFNVIFVFCLLQVKGMEPNINYEDNMWSVLWASDTTFINVAVVMCHWQFVS